jgi:hypothetical protein
MGFLCRPRNRGNTPQYPTLIPDKLIRTFPKPSIPCEHYLL